MINIETEEALIEMVEVGGFVNSARKLGEFWPWRCDKLKEMGRRYKESPQVIADFAEEKFLEAFGRGYEGKGG